MRERDIFSCAASYTLGGESVRASDDENEPFVDGMHLFLGPFGKFDGAEFLAVFVKQHHYVTRLQRFQYQFAFFFLLLFHAQALGVLQFGNDFHVKRSIMLDAFHIVIDGGDVMFLYGASYDE